MMTTSIKASLVAQTHIKASDVDFSGLDPAYRRATTAMTVATLACRQLLDKIPEVPKENISFVLGTHFGEVSSTFDFLKTYHETQVSRPILFQNSLHNSTLGFTTIQLGLTGPALTISTDTLTVRSAFDIVDYLLLDTEFVIVCFADSVPDSIVSHYYRYMPQFEYFQNQAYCFLLTSQKTQDKHKLPSLKPNWDFVTCFI